MKFPLICALGLAAAATALAGEAPLSGLPVEVSAARDVRILDRLVDQAGNRFSRNLLAASARPWANRQRALNLRRDIPLTLPQTVVLTSGGRPLPFAGSGSRNGQITLRFETTGTRVFTAEYRALLQSAFNAARPFLDATFGTPAAGGVVTVRNYDADIPDRAAVVGGLYVPNAPGGPEIRFPVYRSREVAAVNFLHTVLLAYIGPRNYGLDVFQEGAVRAAVMRVARIPAAVPGLDRQLLDNVLAATYDVSPTYDWLNQRALGGRRFIAPNLANQPLPLGGSIGGLYLVRHLVAGTAWQKVLVEDPGFLAEFNRRYYQRPALAGNREGLLALGQEVLNARRPEDPRIEGLPFADWARRQFIFETRDTQGTKVLVEPVPIIGGLAGPDFGVFALGVHAFSTRAGGNEVLLGGTSFPIFWEGNAAPNRIFPSAQEDRLDLFGGYGSIGPNLPNLNAGQPYRAAFDLPFEDRIARVYLPAGAVATASRPTPNDVYGTLLAPDIQSGDSFRVEIFDGNTSLAQIPVQNLAFGANVASTVFDGPLRLRVQVTRRRAGVNTVVLTRRVNKGPGPLALDLRVGGDVAYAIPGGIVRGIQAFGLPVEPYASHPSDVLGITEPNLLLARYNSARGAYDLFPDTGPLLRGGGYYLRSNVAQPRTILGRTDPGASVAIALRPGWNMVSPPSLTAVTTDRVRVVRGAEFPVFYADAVGVDLGAGFFEFRRSTTVDPATGAPETGTMVPATSFQPGRMYFVRCLSPNGATLVFDTALVGRNARVAQAGVAAGWRVRVTATDGQGGLSLVSLGQSPTADRGFQPREDIALPPRLGGFQAEILNGGSLYRDIRRQFATESYTIRLSGLRPGTTVTLAATRELGKAPSLVIVDERGFPAPFGPDRSLRFVARSSQATFVVRTGGLK